MPFDEAAVGALRIAGRLLYFLIDVGGDLFVPVFRWTGVWTLRTLSLGRYPASPPGEGADLGCTILGDLEIVIFLIATGASL